MTAFTLIDAELGNLGSARPTAHALEAAIEGGSVHLAPEALERALGWKLESQGLCRGDVCVPVREPARLLDGDRIDLAALAQLLDRPLALDAGEGVAVLGTAVGDRNASLSSLEAPDFQLPDLAGRMHSLSDHRGKKVLLIAYASW